MEQEEATYRGTQLPLGRDSQYKQSRKAFQGEIQKMNSLVGKSTGIALLMAAALLAALFTMGVFSAGSVGAQDEGPTATAELVDMNTPATADSTADDTLVITFNGLARQAGNATNTISITMEEALGDTSPTSADWKGGTQFADALSISDYTAGAYPVAITAAIETGVAILEIDTTDNEIDSNSIITALTIGRVGALQDRHQCPH